MPKRIAVLVCQNWSAAARSGGSRSMWRQTKGLGSYFRGSWAAAGADCGGALCEGFDLGAQAVAAPDALLLGMGAQVRCFLGVGGFCDELPVGALAFAVGAAESQVGRVWGDARVVAAVGVAGVAGPGLLAGPGTLPAHSGFSSM